MNYLRSALSRFGNVTGVVSVSQVTSTHKSSTSDNNYCMNHRNVGSYASYGLGLDIYAGRPAGSTRLPGIYPVSSPDPTHDRNWNEAV